ncbi:hypothetical protein AJ79_10158 [Helicocarpus griseus UAMH5409]|uniref:DUF292 domain-containing protein n=1 Tax=Helicocarpus griseus UAMH5409 TaxID=1447875 RepID=A0A2B7WF99_9EURO|nr:hypothetical protein AJ79_10158 [Helicocarpus griseus UAMH5409]
MPVPKQTTELIFSLRALIYRIRQLKKERHGYSKAKHRELAKLLKEGRDDLARIKTEDVIGNDNVIAALEILELYCEQLHVRANILDHIALGQKRGAGPRRRLEGRSSSSQGNNASAGGGGGGGGAGAGGWGIWRALGFGSSQPQPHAQATTPPLRPSSRDKDTRTEEQSKDQQQSQQEPPSPPQPEKDVYLDPDLDKAAAVIFYCYIRLPRDIPGLPELRTKLIQRWGNDFATKAQEADPSIPIPEELIDRLKVQNPPESLVENYLKEIARAHGVSWHEEEEEEGGKGNGGEKEGTISADERGGSLAKENDGYKVSGLDGSRKEASVQDRHVHVQAGHDKQPSSVGIAPPGRGPTDLAPSNSPSPNPQAEAPPTLVETKGGGIPEVDELAQRFAALKK